MLSYAGVPLSVPTAEVAEWIERNISVRDVYEYAEKAWPGVSLAHVTHGGAQPYRPIQVNRLWWPRGASQWAVGHFLASESQMASIRPQVWPGGSSYQAKPLLMDWRDASANVVDGISPSLWLLPPRPLQQYASPPQGANLNGFYLLTLVDDRFFWWLADTGSLSIADASTTWANVLASLQSQLGTTITADAVASAYLYPAGPLAVQYAKLPTLLDAVAYNCGQRIVRNLDGTVKSQNAVNGAAQVQLDLQLQSARSQCAGGRFRFDLTDNPRESAAALPATVRVVFPSANLAFASIAPTVYNVTLASLALPELSGVPTNANVMTFWDTCIAWYDAVPTLQNGTALQALANQIATDFYRFQAAPTLLDRKYIGVVAWTPESKHGSIEWTYRLDEVSTRIQPGAWNPLEEWLFHADSVGIHWLWPSYYQQGPHTYQTGTYTQQLQVPQQVYTGTRVNGEIWINSCTFQYRCGDTDYMVPKLDSGGYLPPGFQQKPVDYVTAGTYTVVSGDRGRCKALNNATGVAVTLPASGTGFTNGFTTDFENILSASAIAPAGGTINGAAYVTLLPGQGGQAIYDGSNWLFVWTQLAGHFVQINTATYSFGQSDNRHTFQVDYTGGACALTVPNGLTGDWSARVYNNANVTSSVTITGTGDAYALPYKHSIELVSSGANRVAGLVGAPIRGNTPKTTTYTSVKNDVDRTIVCVPVAASPFTVNLDNAGTATTTVDAGWGAGYSNQGADIITIAPPTSYTIDGIFTHSGGMGLFPGEGVWIDSDGDTTAKDYKSTRGRSHWPIKQISGDYTVTVADYHTILQLTKNGNQAITLPTMPVEFVVIVSKAYPGAYGLATVTDDGGNLSYVRYGCSTFYQSDGGSAINGCPGQTIMGAKVVTANTNVGWEYQDGLVVHNSSSDHVMSLVTSGQNDNFGTFFDAHGTGSITLTPTNSKTIDGLASKTFGQCQGVGVFGDSSGNFWTFRGAPCIIPTSHSGGYTLLEKDRQGTHAYTGSGTDTFTLGSGTQQLGWWATVTNIGSTDLTLTPSAGTINGTSSVTVKAGGTTQVSCDGTNYIAAGNLGGSGSGGGGGGCTSVAGTGTTGDSYAAIFTVSGASAVNPKVRLKNTEAAFGNDITFRIAYTIVDGTAAVTGGITLSANSTKDICDANASAATYELNFPLKSYSVEMKSATPGNPAGWQAWGGVFNG